MRRLTPFSYDMRAPFHRNTPPAPPPPCAPPPRGPPPLLPARVPCSARVSRPRARRRVGQETNSSSLQARSPAWAAHASSSLRASSSGAASQTFWVPACAEVPFAV